jgi:hypothetical protein
MVRPSALRKLPAAGVPQPKSRLFAPAFTFPIPSNYEGWRLPPFAACSIAATDAKAQTLSRKDWTGAPLKTLPLMASRMFNVIARDVA